MFRAIQLALCVAVMAVMAGQSQAGFVSAIFLSTADNTQYNNGYVDNVSFGDQFKVIVAMDNGGSTLLNETWTANDILSVTFDFNNGAHKTVFDPNGGGGFDLFIGSFATNGLGQLTAVPLFFDQTNVNVISTNSSQSPNAWFLDELNDKYYINFSAESVGIPDSVANLIASNWTISSPAAVPEPSSLVLFGIGTCVAGVRAAHRRRRDRKQ